MIRAVGREKIIKMKGRDKDSVRDTDTSVNIETFQFSEAQWFRFLFSLFVYKFPSWH